MKKITELTETRYRTVREKDALGNRVARKVTYTGPRAVNVVSNGKRFAHYFVDLIILETLYFVSKPLLDYIPVPEFSWSLELTLGSYTIGPFFSIYYVVYYLLFEFFYQKTPGKFLTKCRVIDLYGQKPLFSTAFLRNMIRIVPFEAFSCFGERGWHDRWSDTFVVPDEEYEALQKLLAEEPLQSSRS